MHRIRKANLTNYDLNKQISVIDEGLPSCLRIREGLAAMVVEAGLLE